PLTPLPKPGMQTPPICSRKFRVVWTNCCGSSRPTCKPRIESMKTSCLLILFTLSIGSLFTGCGNQGQPPSPAPPTVSVIRPVEREVVEWDEYTGRLESPETVEVRARVSGYLDKVPFKEGKEVKKGDLLFTIDRRPYQAEFDRADAEHQRAESQAELAKN